jgi:hypothetical protein
VSWLGKVSEGAEGLEESIGRRRKECGEEMKLQRLQGPRSFLKPGQILKVACILHNCQEKESFISAITCGLLLMCWVPDQVWNSEAYTVLVPSSGETRKEGDRPIKF